MAAILSSDDQTVGLRVAMMARPTIRMVTPPHSRMSIMMLSVSARRYAPPLTVEIGHSPAAPIPPFAKKRAPLAIDETGADRVQRFRRSRTWLQPDYSPAARGVFPATPEHFVSEKTAYKRAC
jgi:hypothetical protein